MQESKKISPRIVLGAGALALAAGFAGGFVFKRVSAGTVVETPAPEHSVAQPKHRPNARYRIPVTDSQPQRGPKDALVTIVEWCDLGGQACKAADRAMMELMKEYEGRLRWVHRHLIDRTRFAESHRLHAFARGAFQLPDPDDSEKYWAVRERLLASSGQTAPGDAELRRIAADVGVDYEAIDKAIGGKLYAGGLAVDTSFAGRFGVNESPGFFVNGRPVGSLPATKLKQAMKVLIEEELAAANRLLEQGVAKSDVYEELTKDGLWSLDDDPAKRQPAARAAEQH
jgi:protein-disulfide isomerase